MKENKNDCISKSLSDEQLSFVNGGMYHGYAPSGNPGTIPGRPLHGPGVMGPGVSPHYEVKQPEQYLNPMTAPWMKKSLSNGTLSQVINADSNG